MKVIYIASPYTLGDQAQNVAIQKDAAHTILDWGHCPIAPLLTHYLHIRRQRPWDEWMKMDLTLVKKSDLLLRLPGESRGADMEVAHAKDQGIPVAFGWVELSNLLHPDVNPLDKEGVWQSQ